MKITCLGEAGSRQKAKCLLTPAHSYFAMPPNKKTRRPFIDFDLRQLEIFCKVVELKSFSKAAEAVFLAQASVSERISTLEAMIGTRLLDRLGRTVLPTAAGRRLYALAIELLEMKRAACLEMEDFLGLKKGEVEMGGSTIPGEYILPKIIGRFHEKYPGISVNMSVGDSRQIESRVVEGSLELGVIGYKSTNNRIEQFRLWEDELVVAVPKGHALYGRSRIPGEELPGWPFIIREPGSGTFRMFKQHLERGLGMDVTGFHVVASLGSSTAVKEAIKAGLGISILSIHAIEAEVNEGILKPLRIKGLPMKRYFYLVHDKRRTLSPLAQALKKFLLEWHQP